MFCGEIRESRTPVLVRLRIPAAGPATSVSDCIRFVQIDPVVVTEMDISFQNAEGFLHIQEAGASAKISTTLSVSVICNNRDFGFTVSTFATVWINVLF